MSGGRRTHHTARWRRVAADATSLCVACGVGIAALVFAVHVDADVFIAGDVARTAPIPVQRVENASITVDGRLDEAAWQTVPRIDGFRVIEPDTLADAPYPTFVRLMYTERGLYVGFELHQPEETLLARLSSRDQRQINRDVVFITLDTSGEGRYGYWFGIALGDSLLDGTVLPERQYQSDWDGPWYGATAVTPFGWSAEMFLPWSIMTMPRADDLRNIGVFISRRVAHLDQRWAWPPIPDTTSRFLSDLQPLAFRDVALRQQYSVFPYASATRDEVTGERRYRAGADVFWRPSSNFQLMATLTPDFGTAEADDVIVNLSAFETFFPEKRLFFLEGQEIFVATQRAESRGMDGPTTLLHTRRIGGRPRMPMLPPGATIPVTELGRPVDLVGAVKATGQSGGVRYGALMAIEDDARFDAQLVGEAVRLGHDGSRYGVARVLHESSPGGGHLGLGWMGTVADHFDRTALAQGVDFQYLGPRGLIGVDAQLLHSDVDGTGAGAGGFVDVRYTPRRGLAHMFTFDYFDRRLDISDLGFIRRNDLIGTRYIFSDRRSDLGFAREGGVQVILSQEWNRDRRSVRSGLFLQGWMQRNDLSRIRLDANYFPARYEDRNSFGNGTYRIEPRAQFGANYSTDSSRQVALSLNARYEGEELGGYHVSGSGQITWHPLDRLSAEIYAFHRQRFGWLLHQGARDFSTFDAEEWQVRFAANFFVSARQQFRASLQWVGIRADEDERFLVPVRPGSLLPVVRGPDAPARDFSISSLNMQLRYRWELAPLSDLFIVYTRNANLRSRDKPSFRTLFSDAYDTPLAEQLVVKLRYRLGS
jgi:hypothetical protein